MSVDEDDEEEEESEDEDDAIEGTTGIEWHYLH